jgi:hypothetical protein
LDDTAAPVALENPPPSAETTPPIVILPDALKRVVPEQAMVPLFNTKAPEKEFEPTVSTPLERDHVDAALVKAFETRNSGDDNDKVLPSDVVMLFLI